MVCVNARTRIVAYCKSLRLGRMTVNLDLGKETDFEQFHLGFLTLEVEYDI